MNKRQLAIAIQVSFPLLYFLVSFQLPFWGDGIASVSKAAVRIYEEGLLHPWNYPDADPGHPTLFPWLIALSWKIFGFHLWVPHALIAACSYFLGKTLYALFIALSEEYRIWALLLCFLSPLTVSQGVLISLQLPLTLAFFTACNALIKGEKVAFSVSLICLPLIHVQGVLLVGILFLFQTWKSGWKSWLNLKPWIPYLLSGLGFGAWIYFHYLEFGWGLFTPIYERTAPGLTKVFYNLGISVWRLIDLGYFVLIIPALLWTWKRWRKSITGDLEKLFVLSLIVLGFGIPIIFAYPPAHRYVFPVYLLAVPLFLKWLMPKKDRVKTVWLSVAALMLILGNMLFYPGKCLGDQNLVFLNYHTLEEQVADKLLDDEKVYSYAPLNNADKFTYLEERPLKHLDLYGAQLDTVSLIFQSNLNCEFSEEEIDRLRQTHFVTSYENYGVFLNVWMRKDLKSAYPELAQQQEHQPGKTESWLKDLKQKLQGD